jgi:diguanylate cyclase (GGDEF)-like protein
VFSVGAIVAPIIAAAVGSAGLAAIGEASFIDSFRTWVIADVLAYLIFTPFFLSWFEPTLRREIARYAHVECVALTALLALGCYLSLSANVPMMFVVFPLAMLLTIRTGLIGASMGPVTVAAVTLIMTSKGLGPFAHAVGLSQGETIQLIQFQVLAVSFTLFPAAAMLLRQRILSERADQQAAIAAAALDNMAQGLSMFAPDGRMITSNRQYREMYALPEALCRPGVSAEDIVSHQVSLGVWPGELSEYGPIIWQTAAHSDHELNLLDGRTIKIHRRALADGTLVSTHDDVTEQRATQTRIAHLARHDPLTELANRNHFSDELKLALAGDKRPIAMHTIDLDYFKEINDAFGHPAGDTVLETVADRLRKSVREGDLVGRLGGDEFVILQQSMSTENDASNLAERVARILIEPVYIDGAKVEISASVGAAVAHDLEVSAEALMRRSDVALYCAKGDGRSTYRMYKPEMDINLREKKQLEREIKAADHSKDFELYYQPILDLACGEVVSFEALIRWRHPVEGLILPGRFIHAAEESGAIRPIGNWVMHAACLEAIKWPQSVKVAVNVSPMQLRDPSFIDSVASAISSSGICPSRLQMEITESILLQDTEATLRVLAKLKDLGVGISVDDFGTGYSSLSYLRKFSFDTLKIDQSFTRDMVFDKEARAIVESTLGLAHKLGMTTVGEGVETIEQMRLLRTMSCTKVQGYLINRPHPASEIPAMLAKLPIEAKDLHTVSTLAA